MRGDLNGYPSPLKADLTFYTQTKMDKDNMQQERELIEIKKDLDLLDTADNQEHIKLGRARNTTEVKER